MRRLPSPITVPSSHFFGILRARRPPSTPPNTAPASVTKAGVQAITSLATSRVSDIVVMPVATTVFHAVQLVCILDAGQGQGRQQHDAESGIEIAPIDAEREGEKQGEEPFSFVARGKKAAAEGKHRALEGKGEGGEQQEPGYGLHEMTVRAVHHQPAA